MGTDRSTLPAGLSPRSPGRFLRLALLALLLTSAVASAEPWREPLDAPESLDPDLQLGLEVVVAIVDGVGLVDNDAWERRLSRIGYRVAAMSGDGRNAYSFAVIDMPEPNAMALPGGFVLVTRGMMEADLTDDEFAHLLGHEISHVKLRHFARASRVSSILSLARTALLIGVLMSAQDTGFGSQRVAVSDDPGRRDWSVGVTGKEALLQASNVFGSVLQALFERGYSRKIEFEADEGGNQIAVRAGFDPGAGVSLLQHLHERSYEGHRYGYWRTHPYFEDRLARARQRAVRLEPPDEPPDDTPYRERLALQFARLAQQVRDEGQALFLFQRALCCQPHGFSSRTAALELARFRYRRESGRHPIQRHYGAMIGAYREALDLARTEDSTWVGLVAAEREYEELVAERDGLLGEYLVLVERRSASLEMLERFLENYPEHARHEEMTYRLGWHYHLAGRPEEAVERLDKLLRSPAAGAWADSARVVILQAIPDMEDLGACLRLHRRHATESTDGDRAITRAAAARLDTLVTTEFTFSDGGHFLSQYADTRWSPEVRREVYRQAQETYLGGRVQEGMKRFQEALDAYFAVLAYAPESPSAAGARDGIDRINRLETLN